MLYISPDTVHSLWLDTPGMGLNAQDALPEEDGALVDRASCTGGGGHPQGRDGGIQAQRSWQRILGAARFRRAWDLN